MLGAAPEAMRAALLLPVVARSGTVRERLVPGHELVQRQDAEHC